ncbi:MAG: hypothetical protein KC964_29335 [Candidatus Omnitrophica bacterium]|nr:hypothetical protein [Candidatus Omnitrophota bacterium]
MTHPNESNLIDWFLDGSDDLEIESHLESCAACREKVESLRNVRELLLKNEVSRSDPNTTEDVFTAAWTGADVARRKRRSPFGWFRWSLQSAGIFVAGLLVGYVLFSSPSGDPMPGTDGVLPPSHDQEVGERPRNRAPEDLEDLMNRKERDPRTAETSEEPPEEENPDERMASDYWEEVGFRNAKFTPTIRSEGGKKVMGGRLEAETPGGALVVMNY